MIKKKTIKVIGGIIAAIVLIALLYTVIWAVDQNLGVFSWDDDYEEEEEEYISLNGQDYVLGHKVKAYLVLGTDGSGNEDAAGEEYQGSMADFLLLAVVDDENKTYGFLQLNRDTMTKITLLQKDGTGYASAEMQLCTAHWYGKNKKASCKNTVEAVSGLLGGIPIDGYYALPMEQIPALNHAVGGVTVTLQDDFTSVDPTMEKGATLTLNDEQAYAYVRGRMGIGDGENTSRMARQKEYMKAFFAKVMEQNVKDKEFVIKLYEQLQNVSTSDVNMKYISKLTENIGTYKNVGLLVPEGEVKLGEALDDGKEHTEFYIDEASLEECAKMLFPLEAVEVEDCEETEE